MASDTASLTTLTKTRIHTMNHLTDYSEFYALTVLLVSLYSIMSFIN